MKKILNVMSSGLFIFVVLFLMAGLYSIESVKIERDVFDSLFNYLLFEILFILFVGTLALRAIYTKKIFSKLFYAGLILCLLSLFIFMKTGNHASIRLKEGEQVSGIYLTKIKGIPEGLIVIGKERPERFRDIEVEIMVDGRSRLIRPFPFTIVGTRAIGLQDAGISPEIEIRFRGGEKRVALLDLLPPGKVARLPLDNELSVHISLSPEKVQKKGRLELAEFNLKKPFYKIIIKKRGDPVIEGLLRDGDEIYKGGISIRIKETLWWAEFKQRGILSMASFYSGLALTFLGLVFALLQILQATDNKVNNF